MIPGSMHCSDFLARFSDFHDEAVSPAEAEAFSLHLEGCSSCARYREVVRRGVELLRSFPELKPREDLSDRIRHSVYRVEEDARRGRVPFAPSAAMAVAGLATLLAVVVGTQLLRAPEPTVDLPPILAMEPNPAPVPDFFIPRLSYSAAPRFAESDLWTGSNILLYEYSPLGRRHRESGIVRAGLQ